VKADADGRVRFFAPPKAWGSLLDVDCSGATEQHSTLDLADTASYRVEAAAAPGTAATSVRPALTGALESIPLPEILKQGYPPRPDPVRTPERYRRWTELVSAPRAARDVKLVKALGQRAATYSGTYDDTEDLSQPWSGRAFDAAGWTPINNPDFPISPNANSTFYLEYDTIISVPSTACSTSNCAAGEWAGMGGMEALDFITDSNLIQSGIWLRNGSAPTLFIEYAPDAALLSIPGAFSLTAGDVLEIWGCVSSSTSCNDFDTCRTGMVACFGFYNWSSSEFASGGNYPLNPPSGTFYYGYTFESVIEKLLNKDMINYGSLEFSDLAYGVDGNYHTIDTDPWIYMVAYSESHHQLTNLYDSPSSYESYYRNDWVNYR